MNKEIQVEATLDVADELLTTGMSKAARAGMSEAEWREATRFDSTDWGWIIMSIGMAIGAGIVFLPVQVGIVGVWVYLLAAAVGYPALYLFQRLFVNTLAVSPECTDYPPVISHYLGKNSASFLYSFNVTDTILSDNPFYGLGVICLLVAWGAIILNIPVLRLLTWMGPIMGIIGCFIPTYLVYKLDFLARFRSSPLMFIVAAGILLSISPFF